MRGVPLLTLGLLLSTCSDGDATEPGAAGADAVRELTVDFEAPLVALLRSMSPLPPPPSSPSNRVADDPAAAALGQQLFFDPGLSKDGSVSCATCHDPRTAFTDGKQLAVGLAEGRRHTPTLWNVAYHRWLTWDGRADSLWMQALDPIEDPREMGGTRTDVVRHVANDPALRARYEEVFGALPGEALAAAHGSARPARSGEDPAGPVPERWTALADEDRAAIDRAFTNLGKAIAAYQRLLVRGDAPFDRFVAQLTDDGNVRGEPVLGKSAQRGLKLFFGRGNCVLCHSGPNFSDGEFHNNALPTLHGGEPIDAGRYDGAEVVRSSPFHQGGAFSDDPGGAGGESVRSLKRSSDTWGEFRTPSLRNLRGRAPFMHQGQFASLDEVLEFYSEMAGASGRSHHQEQFLVPLRLSESERDDLIAFLDSLEGLPAAPELLERPAD